MKWPATTILVILFLGVAMNIVVAWACVLWSTVEELDGNYKHALVLSFAPKKPGVDESWYLPDDARRGFGVQYIDGETAYRVDPRRWDDQIREMIGRIRAGFPLHSLETWIQHDLQYQGSDPTAPQTGIIHMPPRATTGLLIPNQSATLGFFGLPKALPCRPVWIGFIANSLLYSLMQAAPMLLRLCLRRRRRQCLRCGYPIGTSPVCTECGQPIKRIAEKLPAN